jgi:hypothetical protein
MVSAFCWAHSRRHFFKLADIEAAARRKARGKAESAISPIAIEAVRRMDALFAIERDLNGKTAEERLSARRELSAPRVAEQCAA